MQLAHLALVLLSVTSSIPGHPTKPLDERSTELAWLILVQNNETDNGPRRRVVPKSVFIAPHFDRPCPNGMERVNGKCIKFQELDTEGQLFFLFQKIQSQIGPLNEEEKIDFPGGPAQFHIPIPRETQDEALNSETTERSTLSQITTTELATTTDITTTTLQQQESTTTNTPTTTEWFTTEKETTTDPIYTTKDPETTITTTTDSTTTEIPREIDSFTIPLIYGDEKGGLFDEYRDVFASYSRPERDHRYFNHRNRDKNLWRFNPPWRETPDNTVVLIPKRNYDQLHQQLSYLLRKNR